jgi:hypothetical protein
MQDGIVEERVPQPFRTDFLVLIALVCNLETVPSADHRPEFRAAAARTVFAVGTELEDAVVRLRAIVVVMEQGVPFT